MKKKDDTFKKLLDSSSNTFVDKLASLKYVSKKDSKLLSSVVSGILKKKKSLFFNNEKSNTLMPITVFARD